MTGNLLEMLSSQERRDIQSKSQTLAHSLEQWAGQYPFIRPIRIPTLALVVATVLPQMPFDDCLLVAKTMLWIFGVDDKIDERLVTLSEVRHKAQEWQSVIAQGASDEAAEGDELTAALLEIRGQLVEFPLFEPLRQHWAFCVYTLIETMARECQSGIAYNAQGPSSLPRLGKYLRDGIHSIGMHLWQSTALIVSGDASVLACLEAIEKAIEYAGAAIRLYNDVQTFDKEMHEGGINAILITYHALLAACPQADKKRLLDEAKGHILGLADSYAQRCYHQLERIQTDAGQFEETTRRLVAFHSSFYRQHDYHTTSVSQVNALFDILERAD